MEFLKACQNGDEAKVTEFLANEGINFNQVDDNGKTGFYLACEAEHLQIVQILLKNARDKKIFVNLPDSQGKTPLHKACELQNEELVALIIYQNSVDRLGIDRNRKDRNGKTAFEYLVTSTSDLDAILAKDSKCHCNCCIS